MPIYPYSVINLKNTYLPEAEFLMPYAERPVMSGKGVEMRSGLML